MARPWQIDEHNAPSTRAYLSLVNRWARADALWWKNILEEVRKKFSMRRRHDTSPESPGFTEQEAKSIQDIIGLQIKIHEKSRPKTPSQRQLEAVGEPAHRAAVRATVSSLRKAGAPPRVINSLTPKKPGAILAQVVKIDLFAEGVGRDALVAWAKDGADYIKNLSDSSRGDIAERVLNAAREGRRFEDLAAELNNGLAKNMAHARLIAQDQIAKVNGRITQDLQEKAGVEEYDWVAVGDERTRDSHLEAARGGPYK